MFQEEAGEESVKVGWTRGKNRRGTVDEVDALRGKGRGRLRLRWEDCVKRRWAGVGAEWENESKI